MTLISTFCNGDPVIYAILFLLSIIFVILVIGVTLILSGELFE